MFFLVLFFTLLTLLREYSEHIDTVVLSQCSKLCSVVSCVFISVSLVHLISRVQLFATPWIAARQASLSIINSRSSLKLLPIESVMPSSYLILCYPLLLLPPITPSIRVFSNESTFRMRWPKYWSFSFSISPSKEHPELTLEWAGWISLQPKGFSRVFSNTTVQKHQLFSVGLLYGPTLISTQDYWKSHGFDYTDLCQQSSISAF